MGQVAAELVLAGTHQELVEVATQLDPATHAGLRRLLLLLRLVRVSGLLEEGLEKAVTMLTEQPLIAPGDVAESAQRVIYRLRPRNYGRDRSQPTTPHHRGRQSGEKRFRQPGTPSRECPAPRIRHHRVAAPGTN
jgi:hypothetical protein